MNEASATELWSSYAYVSHSGSAAHDHDTIALADVGPPYFHFPGPAVFCLDRRNVFCFDQRNHESAEVKYCCSRSLEGSDAEGMLWMYCEFEPVFGVNNLRIRGGERFGS